MAAKKPKPPLKRTQLKKGEIVVHKDGGVIAGIAGMRDRVWGSCGLTLNLGEYQSARVDGGMATDVREGEDEHDAYERAFENAVNEVNQQANDLRAALAAGDDSDPRINKRKK